ncbi:MAG TPA: Smr/MutS family protein [Woeseiaceae bacterium]
MPRRKGDDATSSDDEDEHGLFRRLLADAKPLKHDRVPPPARPARPKATFARQQQREILGESFKSDPPGSDTPGAESLRYQHPSVSRHAMRRLARGGYRVQADIDLHGMTSAEAQDALHNFFDEALDRGLTCVRIVHGKGHGSGQQGPVLKRAIDRWLRHWEAVLAFVSARPSDGGTGAVYVLLRQKS